MVRIDEGFYTALVNRREHMNYEYEIKQIKLQLQNLQEIVLKMSRNNTEEVSKREQTTAQVDSLTPYTDQKNAYIGDTEVLFTGVPAGKLSVFIEDSEGNYLNYTVERINDRVTVSFEPLEYIATITISVS